MMGVGRRGNEVYIVDMGVATEYRPADLWGDLRRENPRMMGTPTFACIRGHMGLGR